MVAEPRDVRLIVLAAGAGRRLGSLATERPKCMIPIHGRPLIDWLLATARKAGIADIVLVRGHAAERLQPDGVILAKNPCYAETNMVYTLWNAREWLSDPVIVSYADILYERSVLESVIDAPHPISVAIDRGWRSYWEQRFADPLTDAESLRLDERGCIVDIGGKVTDLNAIQGQYIGLMKFAGEGLDELRNAMERAQKHSSGNGGDFERMYMTVLLQAMAAAGSALHPVWIDRGWLEIDTPQDLSLAERLMQPASNGQGFRITA
jgi:choline kinase